MFIEGDHVTTANLHVMTSIPSVQKNIQLININNNINVVHSSYCKIPVISPGIIQFRKGFLVSTEAKNVLTTKRYFSQCSVASCK